MLNDRIGAITDREVEIVAVTKTHPSEVLEAVVEAGARIIGENYAQEVREKAEAIKRVRQGGAEVHFIGQLQTNKVRMIAEHIDVVQSVDREQLIFELGRRAPGMRIYIQVDTAGGDGRGGCRPDQVGDLIDIARTAGLVVEGLMTLGPAEETGERTALAFSTLRQLAEQFELPVRSMGMSADHLLAVREGSTMVRIGSMLLGERS